MNVEKWLRAVLFFMLSSGSLMPLHASASSEFSNHDESLLEELGLREFGSAGRVSVVVHDCQLIRFDQDIGGTFAKQVDGRSIDLRQTQPSRQKEGGVSIVMKRGSEVLIYWKKDVKVDWIPRGDLGISQVPGLTDRHLMRTFRQNVLSLSDDADFIDAYELFFKWARSCQ